MNLDSLLRTFLSSPTYQRLFMAFTVGLFLSCAARVSDAQPAGSAARGAAAGAVATAVAGGGAGESR